ncbi:MAG: DNA repair protein RadC [Muribaculaceae bacterium]|nr:DNA repair protein RadC [Muribaculaceae bacterium]
MSDSKPLNALSDDDKPREKAMRHGLRTLSAAELIAIQLRTGIVGKSVLEVSRDILALCDNDLATLCRLTPQQLTRMAPGIGPVKAITLMAAIELGARCQSELAKVNDRRQLTSSSAIYNHMRARLERLPHEEFWVLMLNRANRIQSEWMVSQGGMAATIVDIKLLFKRVIDAQASAIALVHNHPSGQLVPSRQDDELTARIVAAGALLDIAVIDHVIISPAGHYSYHDNDRLNRATR